MPTSRIASIAVLALTLATVPAFAADTIKIGVNEPLTGPFAASGAYVVNGAKIAADEINDRGGVLGKKIELVIEDNKSNPTEAAAVAEKLINSDKTPVMMGAWGSSLTLAVMPKLEEYEVPMLVETSSSGKITTSGNPFVFRISPPSALEAEMFAPMVEKLGVKKVDFLVINNDWGRGAAGDFGKMLKGKGIEVGLTETMDASAQDMSAQLAKIKGTDADTLMITAAVDQLTLVFKQMAAMGVKKRVITTGGSQNPDQIIAQGPDHAGRLARMADRHGLRLGDEALLEVVEDRRLDHDLRIGHADLALMQEDPEGGRVDRVVDIGILQHDQRALSAHLERELLEMLRGLDREQAAGLGRAREGHELHAGIGHEAFADFGRHAGHDVQHAGRQPRLLEEVGDQRPGDRRLLRRLQHEGVARREREGDLLHRQQERRIERRDARHDAQRPSHRHRDLPRLGHGHGFAHDVAHIAGRAHQTIGDVGDLPERLVEDRAALVDQHVADFVGAALDDLRCLQQDLLTFARERGAPASEGLVGGVDRGRDLVAARLLRAREDRAVGRVHAVRHEVARGAQPFAADEQLVGADTIGRVVRGGVHAAVSWKRWGGDRSIGRRSAAEARSRMMRSAARSPIRMQGAMVLPPVTAGMIEPSAMRSPATP